MCVDRTPGRLSSGSEASLGGEQPTKPRWMIASGWLSSTLAAASAASASSDVRPFSRERIPVGYIQLDQDNGNGYGARQTKASFTQEPEGRRIILYL